MGVRIWRVPGASLAAQRQCRDAEHLSGGLGEVGRVRGCKRELECGAIDLPAWLCIASAGMIST